ncbi:lysophospholipase D GDPD3a [Leuresthes tenuis]|uniref:lysophospholipase D GDPD3a n=1 Tax=Leuresthes tenuis TaxID=355514 RepID=UPI003B50C9E5
MLFLLPFFDICLIHRAALPPLSLWSCEQPCPERVTKPHRGLDKEDPNRHAKAKEKLIFKKPTTITQLTVLLQVSDLVQRYNREGITVWASADAATLKECHRTNDSMPYSFSMKRGVLLLLLFYSGLLPFVPLGESLLQFYLPSIINRTYIPKKKILRNRLVLFLIEKITMRKSLFEHLAARGIQVHLFVCNEEEDIKAAFDVGATGVMTDYPTLLSSYLHRNRCQD